MVRAGALRHQSRRDEALQALDTALAYTRSDRALDVAEVRTAKGEVLRDAHRFDEALLEFDVAEKLVGDRFREPAGFVRWLELQLARVEVYYWLGNLDQISPLLERVEPYVDDLADTEQRIRFYGSARTAMLRRDRFDPSDQLLRLDTIAYEESLGSEDPHTLAWARFVHGFTLLCHRDLAAAKGLLLQSLEDSETLGDSILRSRSLTYLMLVDRLRRDLESTSAVLETVVEAAREAGHAEYEAMVTANRAWIAYRRGDLDAAEQFGIEAVQNWSELPTRYFLDWMACMPLLATAHVRGDLASAARWARAMIAETQQRLPQLVADSLTSAVRDIEAGDERDASAHLQLALQSASEHGLI